MSSPTEATVAETAAHGEAHGEAVHEAFLGFDATGWVAIAMLLLFGIMLWKKVPAVIAGALDSKIAAIKAQLDEAARLRSEAEALLADYRAKQAQAERDAVNIVATARTEADRIVENARSQAETLVERRTRMAEDKIAAAQRAAESEIRSVAAELGTEAARRLIADQAATGQLKGLVDDAIGQVDSRLH